jgi:hypothetical protein
VLQALLGGQARMAATRSSARTHVARGQRHSVTVFSQPTSPDPHRQPGHGRRGVSGAAAPRSSAPAAQWAELSSLLAPKSPLTARRTQSSPSARARGSLP